MENSEDLFLSEVHVNSVSVVCNDHFVTRFVITLSEDDSKCKSNEENQETMYDSDGDMCVKQMKYQRNSENIIPLTIKHANSTNLDNVGKQIWSGALLLADYILNEECFNDSFCIELGSGVGLSSIVASLKVKHIFVTDYSDNILQLCQDNIKDNNVNPNSQRALENVFSVKKLDWNRFKQGNYANLNKNFHNYLLKNGDSNTQFQWVEKDIVMLKKTDFIFTADCIYDNEITDCLFSTLLSLVMSSEKEEVAVIFTIEKRINFTLADLDVKAPAYDYFRQKLSLLQKKSIIDLKWNVTCKQIPIKFMKYLDYERTNFLELWKVVFQKV